MPFSIALGAPARPCAMLLPPLPLRPTRCAWMNRLRCLLAVASATVALAAGRAAAGESWQRTGEEDGVLLETRDVAGAAMPEFRGTTTIPADLYDIAAVLDDLDRYCDWQKRCVKARELARAGELDRHFYTRTGAPWPLHDRDAVLRGRTTGLAEGADVWVRFESVADPRWPPVDGVVRMPLTRGHWRLVRIDGARTRVEFQVQVDPGGIVPAWAARLSARQVPRDTLAGLRRHVPRMIGKYAPFLARWRDKPQPAPDPSL